MGVPQGSVLSVTLFALKINSIVKAISPGVECSLHVDDFLIVYRSKYIHIIERHLQRSLNMLSHWADTNGFKFSSSKTVCMHLCRLRNAHPNPELKLNGTLIPVVEQTKFIGVIFDNKLTFLPHIRYLKEKCLKALNLLRVVAHTSWGADQHTLLHLYRSLVRSKLDYGSVVYRSARESYAYWIRYRTMHCGYVFVPSEPHLALVYAFKPTNLHSTYGEEYLAYSIPSDLAHPRAIRLTILSSAQNSKLRSLQNLMKSQHWAFVYHRSLKRLVLRGILYLSYPFQPLPHGF